VPGRDAEVDERARTREERRAVLDLGTPRRWHAGLVLALAERAEARADEGAARGGSSARLHGLANGLRVAGGGAPRVVEVVVEVAPIGATRPVGRHTQDGQQERVWQASAHGDGIVPPAAEGNDAVEIVEIVGGGGGRKLARGLELLSELLPTVRPRVGLQRRGGGSHRLAAARP